MLASGFWPNSNMEEKFDYTKIEPQVKDLFEVLLNRNYLGDDKESAELIRRAFELAYRAHDGVKRKSGEPYIVHPLEVAIIVSSEIGLGAKSIAAALLHDVIEDTDYSQEDLAAEFGEQIASMVDGLTKLSDVFYQDYSVQAENFKKLLLTLQHDLRVILIKIADRLHNMRTLKSMPVEKRMKISSETLYLFAPIAQRLGLYSIKSELEDLSFQYRHPEIHQDLSERINTLKVPIVKLLESAFEPIQNRLNDLGIKHEFDIIFKSPSSIYNKIKHNKLSFEEIQDIYLIRIIFEPVENSADKNTCWNIYSIVTDFYTPRPDRIRDLISNPKNNGYQALHFTILTSDGTPIELQVRSKDMHTIAEYGYVTYWKQKGIHSQENVINDWVKQIRVELDASKDALEFVEEFKANLFSQEIRVFTHKGHLRKIPKGSTVLDFAYSIHTDLGNNCIGAQINHKMVGRDYILKQGDYIEILSSDTLLPDETWLDIVITAKAKSKIKESIKNKRKEKIQEGDEILRLALLDEKTNLDTAEYNELVKYFHYVDLDEILIALANKELGIDSIRKFLKRKGRRRLMNFWNIQLFGKSRLNTLSGKDPFEFGNCCNPIPGDEIIGFKLHEEHTDVHKKDCAFATDLMSKQGNKLVQVKWSVIQKMSSSAVIELKGADTLGLVWRVTREIYLSKVNMRTIHFNSRQGIFEGEIELYVSNTEDLNNLILKLSKIKGIDSVKRIDQLS